MLTRDQRRDYVSQLQSSVALTKLAAHVARTQQKGMTAEETGQFFDDTAALVASAALVISDLIDRVDQLEASAS